MHTAVSSISSHRLLCALGAVIFAGGCAPSSYAGAGDARVAAAGASVKTTISTPFIEASTVSLALDRIDQRSLPLDKTYRHFGSGRGVTVYVFDGGVLETHPELEGRVRRGYDAFPNEEHLCNAHGTAVAGAVAGTTLGVAPDAQIVDVKMVECRRMRGTIEAIVRGAKWVLADHALHPQQRAIANWSFIADTSASLPALDAAVRELLAAGIPVVVSAGNLETDACRVSPANAPGSIVVGASRVRRLGLKADAPLADERAANTAYGPCIDIFAPGDSVLLPSLDVNNRASQQLWTGTSMSAGYVSGALALYLEAHPFATPESASAWLMSSASRTAAIDEKSRRAGMLYVGPNEPRAVSSSKSSNPNR
jgi:subtilisin family serine protease